MPSSGTLQYNDDPAIKIKSPYDAVAHNIGYRPRERKVEGIFMSMSVAENMTSSQMQRYSHYGLLKKQAEKEMADAWIDRLSIKTQSSHTDCSRLSGGNQQKVVLAKWRSSGAKLMMLDHPTRGLDIGAKQDVYEMIRNMAADGLGLVVVPDTFEEAIGLAHKVIVMKDGRVSEEFDCDQQDVRPLDLIAAMT
jgi:ribose transport system ATP-binding protein